MTSIQESVKYSLFHLRTIPLNPINTASVGVNSPSSKLPPLFLVLEINQLRENQSHVPPLVHDMGATIRARGFTRQIMPRNIPPAVVELQSRNALHESDISLVKDGCPLERGSCKRGRKDERNVDNLT